MKRKVDSDDSKQRKNKKRMKNSRNIDIDSPAEKLSVLPATRSSEDVQSMKCNWTNKQKVLIFSTRGVSYLARHVMKNLRALMPHTKSEPKIEIRKSFSILNEVVELRNCNKVLFFDMKKKKDLYLWMGNVPDGPTVKFLVENLHTMEELKLTGNCLKGSRPLLSFDEKFDKESHWKLIKELLTQIFGTPYHQPKSQPFVDHVLSFSIIDNKIWFRNYQIVEENGALAEIGPRFVLNLHCIFEKSFCGMLLYENPQYIAPNLKRRLAKMKASQKYKERIYSKVAFDQTKPKESYTYDKTDEIFQTKLAENAEE